MSKKSWVGDKTRGAAFLALGLAGGSASCDKPDRAPHGDTVQSYVNEMNRSIARSASVEDKAAALSEQFNRLKESYALIHDHYADHRKAFFKVYNTQPADVKARFMAVVDEEIKSCQTLKYNYLHGRYNSDDVIAVIAGFKIDVRTHEIYTELMPLVTKLGDATVNRHPDVSSGASSDSMLHQANLDMQAAQNAFLKKRADLLHGYPTVEQVIMDSLMEDAPNHADDSVLRTGMEEAVRLMQKNPINARGL